MSILNTGSNSAFKLTQDITFLAQKNAPLVSGEIHTSIDSLDAFAANSGTSYEGQRVTLVSSTTNGDVTTYSSKHYTINNNTYQPLINAASCGAIKINDDEENITLSKPTTINGELTVNKIEITDGTTTVKIGDVTFSNALNVEGETTVKGDAKLQGFTVSSGVTTVDENDVLLKKTLTVEGATSATNATLQDLNVTDGTTIVTGIDDNGIGFSTGTLTVTNVTQANSVNTAELNITGETVSNSTSTGALTVEGGVGIGGDVNIGGSLTVSNTNILDTIESKLSPDDVGIGDVNITGGVNAAGEIIWNSTDKEFNFNFTLPKGDPGDKGDTGFYIKAVVDRCMATSAWDTSCNVGEDEYWNDTSNDGFNEGDLFLVSGISSDTGKGHLALFKYIPNNRQVLYGNCIGHSIISAKGTDGTTPQFNIENNNWYVSYDNGTSWQELGNAKGTDGVRGSQIYSGTKISGTSTTETLFSASTIASALANDIYINTETFNYYMCITGGNPDTAKWKYMGSLKGPKGDTLEYESKVAAQDRKRPIISDYRRKICLE